MTVGRLLHLPAACSFLNWKITVLPHCFRRVQRGRICQVRGPRLASTQSPQSAFTTKDCCLRRSLTVSHSCLKPRIKSSLSVSHYLPLLRGLLRLFCIFKVHQTSVPATPVLCLFPASSRPARSLGAAMLTHAATHPVCGSPRPAHGDGW